ncbi:3-methyl-2-oxobutanoate hydroxymethyltransferase [Loktanella sp. F6476L]|uniref:3-methyl-2-oxobutanoate hydroxymethyltransferase n=1 Tax=Loktanella sp. F6476L TaxID=2926405 RepID=UPI001FF66261|nr:3-methyl-2-oxobutanoate hydroxymethyltransferase [Loktanella sp. F6476L]MCK0120259.1 3-methyl-2-oxobutanoate hydroxymethyltransferase [Loktanella sp. F6476L]
MTQDRKKLTLPELAEKKAAGKRLVMVAVGEVLTATWAERAGVDIVGVGDSLGMTLHGHENTLAMTVDQMIMHTQAVRRGAPNTLCLVSMPYGSYATPDLAVTNAVRMMKESGADALKLQLGREGTDIIRAVADAGVPVMSHVGLLPHKIHQMGGFKMQGRTAEAAMDIVADARAIEAAGAIGLEIEAMPYEVGKAVDDAVDIFTFSIGAGAAGTCQLLNGYDLLGAFDTFKPKFAKRYANLAQDATDAFAAYADDVRSGRFPDAEHSYQMKPDEIARFETLLNSEDAT